MTEFTDTPDFAESSQQLPFADEHLYESQSAVRSADMPNNNKADKASEKLSGKSSEKVPAVEVELSGQHLIEASAGTGKTWTLTGIVLRLLIEARRAPEQIIATTFTRAAAAEMRQRIHERLVEFYQLLQWVNSLSSDVNNKDMLYPKSLQVTPEQINSKSQSKENPSQKSEELNQDLDYEQQNSQTTTREKRAKAKEERDTWLIQQASYARLDSLMQDPINLHLISYLLDHVYSYPMTEAIRRTALVLTTLDNLFVGTLDSLAQKWLTEYSSETGHQQGMGIIEDSSIEQVTDSIIHDELRQFQSRLYHEQPKLYTLLEQQGKLTDIGDHKGFVTRSLNFISAPIDEVKLDQDFDFSAYEKMLYEFAQLDLADIQPYLNSDYRKSQGFRGNSNLINHFDALVDVHHKIAEHQLAFTSYLDERENKILTSLQDSRYPNEEGKIKNFNKDREKEHQALFGLDTIVKLMAILDMVEKLDQHIISLLANLNRHIVLAVRDRLPVILEERGETTFGLQMVRLNQALTGKQGPKLARYIRHHYPIALIDESQDINGEQALMIKSIYLANKKSAASANDKQSSAKKTSHEFLLLVGDPKQAIYGFRGGDVANYNDMKAQFDKQSFWTLDVNRRSNAGVIHALNCWFGMATPSTGDNKLSQLGAGIYYQHIKAAKPDSQLSWSNMAASETHDLVTDLVTEVLSAQPVSLLHLPYDNELEYDEYEITARHIAALLSSNQTLKGVPIQPSDIGVLARTKKDLKQVEDELVKLKVPTLTTSDVSIFETIMAEDVAALLSAMLYPYRHDMINRVLTSHLYGLNIKAVRAMMTDHESGAVNRSDSAHKQSYQDFIAYIKEGAQRWQHFGILSALHYLLDKSPVQSQGVWQALANHPEGDRHIMDLRHVLDVMAQYGSGMGEHELLAWFRQNIDAAPNSDWAKQYPLPTESGVQLMTIHKSKGLEFPIVYVLGMGDASRRSGNKEQYGLYLYNDQSNRNSQQPNTVSNQRRFSPVQGSATKADYYTEFETQEGFDELRRLGYVAFTRASEQLYVVLKDAYSNTNACLRPVCYWLDVPAKNIELPDRLKGTIGMLRAHKINEYHQKGQANKANTANGLTTVTTKLATQKIEYAPFLEVMRSRYFFGWAKTSFTALARQLDESTQIMAVVDERIDDAIDIETRDSVGVIDSNEGFKPGCDLELKREDGIRFTFVKGANAGTFLHEIFEKIDFNNQSQWSQVIDRAVSSYQLPLIYSSAEQQQRVLQANKKQSSQSVDTDTIVASQHEALMGWIKEVLQTPLLASNQPLESIDTTQRFAELEFNMGLSEHFRAEDITTLFAEHLPNEPDKHVTLVAQNKAHLYRYLRGEIDLVYEHAGKYYVVDYKSNYLGNSLSNYDEKTLKQAMSKAGYWLQAAIYQVALHRFLSMRVSDYDGNEDKYLGPVEYVFLRGVYHADASTSDSALDSARQNKKNTADCNVVTNKRFGLVIWDIPIDFIKALDTLLGLPD